MAQPSWSDVRALFQAACDLPDETARRSFVIERASGDSALSEQVLSLLDSLERAGSFLDGDRVGPMADLQDLARAAPPRERIGPWRIVRVLGRGGMGLVYLGEREADGVTLRAAVKVVGATGDVGTIAHRLRSERQILAALDHPGIARLLDAGTSEDGLPYFAAEFVDGVPLTDFARGLDLPSKLRLFVAVCEALEFAHRRLVVHRDLKPGNILVTAGGQPKLLDFGIAKLLTAEQPEAPGTVTARGWLTPAYAAPEQLRGEPTSMATDVYALGLILYELVTGCAAVPRGTDPVTAARAKTEGNIPRPSTAVLRATATSHSAADIRRLARALKGDIDTIVLKAIAVDPARRYGTAAELAAEITRYLDGRPVAARPDSLTYRTGKFVRRHRWAVSFAAVAILALAGGLLLALVGRQRALRAEAEARASATAAARVSDFLVGLFRVSDPGEARGSSVTARELLDRGADRIETELAGDPDVRVRLRDVMAQAYGELGLYDRQVDLLTAQIADASARSGAGSQVVLALLTRLSVAEMRRGRYAESRDLALKAVAGLEPLGGPARLDLARALSQAANAYRELGDLPAASEYLEHSLAVRETLSDQSPDDLVAILNNAAILRWRQGALDAARPLYERALALAVATHGEDHPSVGHTLNNFAILELAARRHGEAAALHRRALALRRRLLAADHPDIAESLNNLCDVELARKDYAAARLACEEALAIRRRIFPDPHPLIATTEVNLGLALARAGELDEGRQLLLRSLTGFERSLGPEHMAVSYPLDGLADVESARGRRAAAEPLLRRALRLRERVLGPGHDEVTPLRDKLVALLRETGREAEAARLAASAGPPAARP